MCPKAHREEVKCQVRPHGRESWWVLKTKFFLCMEEGLQMAKHFKSNDHTWALWRDEAKRQQKVATLSLIETKCQVYESLFLLP